MDDKTMVNRPTIPIKQIRAVIKGEVCCCCRYEYIAYATTTSKITACNTIKVTERGDITAVAAKPAAVPPFTCISAGNFRTMAESREALLFKYLLDWRFSTDAQKTAMAANARRMAAIDPFKDPSLQIRLWILHFFSTQHTLMMSDAGEAEQFMVYKDHMDTLIHAINWILPPGPQTESATQRQQPLPVISSSDAYSDSDFNTPERAGRKVREYLSHEVYADEPPQWSGEQDELILQVGKKHHRDWSYIWERYPELRQYSDGRPVSTRIKIRNRFAYLIRPKRIRKPARR